MWELAYQMARSGEHSGYQSIEWALRDKGFSRARMLLDDAAVREKLNCMCAESKKGAD